MNITKKTILVKKTEVLFTEDCFFRASKLSEEQRLFSSFYRAGYRFGRLIG